MGMRKHIIGIRERKVLDCERQSLIDEISSLNEKDDEGFIKFYYDVETNAKKVKRRLWLDEVLSRGSYHIEKK